MAGDDVLTPADLLALVESAKTLSAEIDLPDLLEKILKRAGELTTSPSGGVLLYDAEKEGLFFAAATGPKGAGALATFGEFAPERVPTDPEKSKAGFVFTNKKPRVWASVAADPNHFKGVDEKTHHRTDSMLCVPLAIGSEIIGVVQLLNKESGEYTERDVVLLDHFASHAAIAIRNAQHFQDLLAHKGLMASSARGRKTIDLLRELAAPAHEERMTVMFADMRGFTRLTRELGTPTEIEKYLNKFLSLLAREVMRRDGVVNKFLGDGILAIFRGETSEIRAARSAFAITDEVASLRDQWNRDLNEDVSFVDVGVGIATGNAVIGSIGSGRVKDFTALGAIVNLAAAFEHDARGGKRVLVDQNTYNAIQRIVREVGEVSSYELKKADQPSGTHYKRYEIRRLLPEPGAPQISAPGRRAFAPTDLRAYYSDSWAVVVGIDQCKDARIPRLGYAVADAREVAKALPRLGFPSERIIVLENDQASRDAIQRALYGNAQAMGENDRLLVFFAVHGKSLKSRRSEEGYLLPYDVDAANLPLSGLPMSDLSKMGQRLPAKHILFVLDTCFSGYAARREAPTAPISVDLTALTDEPVVQVLTAGTSEQTAIEEDGHGLFTRSFLKGLEGWADRDGKGLTLARLAAHIQDDVVRKSENRQTPQYGKLDGEGEFLFSPPRG